MQQIEDYIEKKQHKVDREDLQSMKSLRFFHSLRESSKSVVTSNKKQSID
jgi:hypothetical protein